MKNKSRRRRAPKKNKPQISHWLIVGVAVVFVGAGLFLFLGWANPTPAQSVPSVTPSFTATTVSLKTPVSKPISVVQPTDTPVSTPVPVIKNVDTPPSLSAATATITASVSTTPIYTYTVINAYNHDRNAFTQGLIYLDDIFYEGTGLYGRSTLRKVNPETGEVLQIINLPVEVFGEGITVFDDKVYQLTWKAGRAFVYNKDTFELLHEFAYPTQGWGLTHNGKQLIMSDGTANLYFRDPDTFEEISRVVVFDENGPVVRLNELEYINGEVYANVWQTDRIAIINPKTGRVTGWIILPNLLTPEDLSEPVDVLNGIAYDAETNRLFITGKFWPRLFEIKLVPIALPASQPQ